MSSLLFDIYPLFLLFSLFSLTLFAIVFTNLLSSLWHFPLFLPLSSLLFDIWHSSNKCLLLSLILAIVFTNVFYLTQIFPLWHLQLFLYQSLIFSPQWLHPRAAGSHAPTGRPLVCPVLSRVGSRLTRSLRWWDWEAIHCLLVHCWVRSVQGERPGEQ